MFQRVLSESLGSRASTVFFRRRRRLAARVLPPPVCSSRSPAQLLHPQRTAGQQQQRASDQQQPTHHQTTLATHPSDTQQPHTHICIQHTTTCQSTTTCTQLHSPPHAVSLLCLVAVASEHEGSAPAPLHRPARHAPARTCTTHHGTQQTAANNSKYTAEHHGCSPVCSGALVAALACPLRRCVVPTLHRPPRPPPTMRAAQTLLALFVCALLRYSYNYRASKSIS